MLGAEYAAGVHFLTGDQAIDHRPRQCYRLPLRSGSRTRRKLDQFAHSSVIMFATPGRPHVQVPLRHRLPVARCAPRSDRVQQQPHRQRERPGDSSTAATTAPGKAATLSPFCASWAWPAWPRMLALAGMLYCSPDAKIHAATGTNRAPSPPCGELASRISALR